MNRFRVAMAQVDPTLGALGDNTDKIAACAHDAARQGADLVIFPELAISGYPPEDLVIKRHFVSDCRRELNRLARELPPETTALVGTPWEEDNHTYNAAAIFHGGSLHGAYRKMLLPNYGVFDEKRVFDAGTRPMVLRLGQVQAAVHICEDSWFENEAPCTLLQPARPDLLINLSASPYARGKLHDRVATLSRTAGTLGCPLIYVNLVGGQDELVFDGASLVLAPDGEVMARARQFEEQLMIFDLPIPVSRFQQPVLDETIEVINLEHAPAQTGEKMPPVVEPELGELEEIYGALKLGLRDYVDKNRFPKVLVALSGGIDSALVAVLAVDALGPDRVVLVTMPSQYSSEATHGDAADMAERLGAELHDVAIGDLFDHYVDMLNPLWPGREADTTEENLQARIRGNIIMALSNKFGWLVLATGNKSEMATGYCTLYGDMVGGFAVIKDVPKTLVFDLCRWRNENCDPAPIPPSIIERPPSAELRPDQKDTDSLPPYEELDPILEGYVERDLGVDEIAAEGFDPDLVMRVIRLVDVNEYKRRQGAPGIKITPKAFGRDRRLPITNAYRDHLASRRGKDA